MSATDRTSVDDLPADDAATGHALPAGDSPGGDVPGHADSILVRYFAAARAGTGRSEERLDIAPGTTLAELGASLPTRHPGIQDVVPACSYLVNGVSIPPSRATDPASSPVLRPGDTVDVLPPFAGG